MTQPASPGQAPVEGSAWSLDRAFVVSNFEFGCWYLFGICRFDYTQGPELVEGVLVIWDFPVLPGFFS